jgi:uncharacterized protein
LWCRFITPRVVRDEQPQAEAQGSRQETQIGESRLRQTVSKIEVGLAMDAELKTQLNTDLKDALRAGDKVKLSVIRMVLSEIKNAEMAKQEKLMAGFLRQHLVTADDDEAARQIKLNAIAREVERIIPETKLANADILGVLSKQAKQREESIAAYTQGKRPDLVVQEEAELLVLRTYLPQAASRDDIVAAVKKAIADTGAQSARDKGKVMPRVIAELKGRADGRQINEVVTELLQ